MNKQKRNIPRKPAEIAAKTKPPVANKQSSMSDRDRNIALLSGVAIIIFICFRYTLHNQFLSDWDDWIYIQKDKYIKAFTAVNFHNMLFRDITLNYYHPLTLLSLAVNYQFSQMDPMPYYLTNILLHIVNAILVFYLIKTLMNAMIKEGYKVLPMVPWIVAVGALLHGVHPMHVESVSWIAERKDVMYAVFYFSGLIMYVRYMQGATFRWMLYLNIVFAVGCLWGMVGLSGYSLDVTKSFLLWDPIILLFPFILVISLIIAEWRYKSPKIGMFYVMEFFLLSMLSKPMAVSFPLSLIVVDILLKRDKLAILDTPGTEIIYKIFFKWFFNLLPVSWFVTKLKSLVRLFIEKWAFLVIAVLSGAQSIYMQGTTNTLAFTNGYSVSQKFLIACYTFTTYMVKAFYPANLCSYYPFPNLISSERYLPTVFYFAPLSAAAIAFLPLYLTRKNNNIFRVVLFGLGFYFTNLVFVLQFLSAGTTIISERYSYVAYFGPIFVLVYIAHWYWQKNKKYHVPIQVLLGGICLIFCYLSSERTKVWHDPETLWTDVISKTASEFPQTPYFNLASYYIDNAQYDKAYGDYEVLVKIGSKDPLVYRNLAMIEGMHKQTDSSLYFFARALQYDSTDASIYTNRGITYANMGKLDLAVKDLSKAYSLDTSKYEVLAQEASILSQLTRYGDAIADYNKLIKKQPDEPTFYMMRGNDYLNGGNPGMAMQDYLHVLQSQPKNGECMYYLSMAYHETKDNAHALQYANMAQTAGFKLPDNYLSTLK